MTDQTAAPEANATDDHTTYFWLPRDEVLARRRWGVVPQVWHGDGAAGGKWTTIVGLDLAGEGNRISEQEALDHAGLESFPPDAQDEAPEPDEKPDAEEDDDE